MPCSQVCRCCGPLRFDLYAVLRMCCLRRYQGRLTYKLGEAEAKVIEGEFTMFVAVNMAWIDAGSLIAPDVRPDSGFWDIWIMVSRTPGYSGTEGTG